MRSTNSIECSHKQTFFNTEFDEDCIPKRFNCNKFSKISRNLNYLIAISEQLQSLFLLYNKSIKKN